jgi:ABC-2 type transport system permease protein
VKSVNNSITTSPIKCLKALFKADFIVLKTRPSVIISIALPVFLLIIWNNKGTISSYGGALPTIAIVICTGILTLSVMGYSISTARDREKGVFQRLRVTPAPTWTIMASRILVQEITNLLIAFVVLVIGSHLYKVSLSVEDYVLVMLTALMAGLVFLSIGQALVGLIKSADSINSIGRFVYIAFIVFGLSGLSGGLGHTVEIIAKWTPYGSVITVFEGIPHLGTWSTHTSFALLTCAGYILVFSFIGVKWFKWEAR